MTDDIILDSETLLDLARFAFLRLDGAWFMAAAKKNGIEDATDLDVKAWELFSERLAKKIISVLKLGGNFSKDFPTILRAQHMLMKMNGKVEVIDENKIILQVRDCEIWEMVQKVWKGNEIPCHKVTTASITGLLKGAFPNTKFEVNHTKKIPLGDECCQVEITLKG